MPGLGQRVQAAIPMANAMLIWNKEPRYDTFLTVAGAPGVGVVPFFSIPRGAIGSGFAAAKTEAETNMNAGSQIGKPNQFLVHGFMVQAQVSLAHATTITAIQDFAAIYTTGLFRYILGTNTQLEVPLSAIPAGPGPTGFASGAVAGAPLETAAVVNGTPLITHYYDFRTEDGLPTLLDGSQSFRCELIYTGAGGNLITTASTRIKCFVMGIYGKQM